jgi:hypothetical protein
MSDIVRKDSDEGRTYETPNGELKSVTNYLGLLNKPALVPWAAKMTAEYFKDEIDAILAGELSVKDMDLDDLVKQAKAHYKKKSEEATEYGSMVHDYIASFFGFGALPEDPIVKRLVISAVSKITGELRLTVNETEKMVYYRSAYAGTLDLIGSGIPVGHKSKKRVIVDVKTGRGRVYEEALLQVSAYALAEEELSGQKVDLAVILPLNKDTGEADDLVVLNRRRWKKYARAFMALVAYDMRVLKARDKK